MSGSTTVTLSTRIRKRVSGGNRIMRMLLHRWDARVAIIILSLLTLSGARPRLLLAHCKPPQRQQPTHCSRRAAPISSAPMISGEIY